MKTWMLEAIIAIVGAAIAVLLRWIVMFFVMLLSDKLQDRQTSLSYRPVPYVLMALFTILSTWYDYLQFLPYVMPLIGFTLSRDKIGSIIWMVYLVPTLMRSIHTMHGTISDLHDRFLFGEVFGTAFFIGMFAWSYAMLATAMQQIAAAFMPSVAVNNTVFVILCGIVWITNVAFFVVGIVIRKKAE